MIAAKQFVLSELYVKIKSDNKSMNKVLKVVIANNFQ